MNQKSQMTQEELQKTQVLNLKDVEEVARYEKMVSKKPAIIIALIGVVSIFFGTTFGVAQSLAEKPVNNTDTSKVEARKADETSLTCVLNVPGNADGTDQVFNVVYTFTDNKLTGFTRKSTILPTAGNVNGASAIESYKNAFPQYLVSLKGYEVSIAQEGSGILCTTKVDYSKIDLTTFPENQQNTPYTKIDYAVGTDKLTLQTDLVSKGFTCQ